MNKTETVQELTDFMVNELIDRSITTMEDSAEKIKEIGINLQDEYNAASKRKDALAAINALWKSASIYKSIIEIKAK